MNRFTPSSLLLALVSVEISTDAEDENADKTEDVASVEDMSPGVTRMPGGVTVGDSGLCCCVPCLSNALTSPSLPIDLYKSFLVSFIM